MPGLLAISGLGSGIDWSSIIEKLMEIEHRPVDLLEQKKKDYEDKLSAWQDINTKLLSLKTGSEDLSTSEDFSVFKAGLSSNSSTDPEDILLATTGSSATPGTYNIRVLSLATSKALQSKAFTSSTTGLGISGDILINGQVVSVSATDSLTDISGAINSLNSGTNPTGVIASIVKLGDQDYRLTLTAEDTGATGFTILNAGANNLLQDLGLANTTKGVLHQVSGGAESNRVSDSATAIGTLLGLSSPPSGTVQVAGVSVSLDLSTDTLDDIASKINTAWQNAGNTGNIAEVLQDGSNYYLRIYSTNLVDDSNVLETLGVLTSQQGSVAEVHQNDTALTSGGSPVTSSTLITAIDTATGTPKDGETITISGTDHDGNAVQSTFTITTTSTVGDLLTSIETAFNSNVTAAVTADGYLTVTDNLAGGSQLSIQLLANNEQGGGLNFGSFSATVEGYDMETAEGQDAQIDVNGNIVSTSSNDVTDVIPGVTLDLIKADSNTTITLSIDRDVDSIIDKIKSFFDSANDIVNYINDQYTFEEGKERPLIGDTTLHQLKMDLSSNLRDPVQGLDSNKNFLSWIGITTDNYGVFSIDEETLREKLVSNFDDVEKLFTSDTSTTGIAARVDTFIDNITNSYEYGYVSTRIDTINDNISKIDDEIEDMERILEIKRENLYQQYNTLEQFITQMNGITNWLNQQFK